MNEPSKTPGTLPPEVIVPDLVPETHPALSAQTDVFDFANPPVDPVELAHILAQALIKYKGVGISANQLGLPYRAFAMATNPITVCINPRIVDIGNEEVLLEEGCLSYPGVFVKIKRPKTIKVRYTQPNGETETRVFSGMTARIYQHELDHQDGKNFLDLAGPMARKLALKKFAKHKKLEKLRKQFVR
jgi:peptide deformylase